MKKKTVREPIATWWKTEPYDVQITPVKDVRVQLIVLKRVKGYAPCPLDDCKVVLEKGMKP